VVDVGGDMGGRSSRAGREEVWSDVNSKTRGRKFCYLQGKQDFFLPQSSTFHILSRPFSHTHSKDAHSLKVKLFPKKSASLSLSLSHTHLSPSILALTAERNCDTSDDLVVPSKLCSVIPPGTDTPMSDLINYLTGQVMLHDPSRH